MLFPRRAAIGMFAIATTALFLTGCPDGKKPGPAAAASGSSATASSTTGDTPKPPTSDKEFKIGWSVWTGWMPF